MDRSASPERVKLAAGFENKGISIMVRFPPESLHSTVETEHIFK
jgi:hypothetical protein